MLRLAESADFSNFLGCWGARQNVLEGKGAENCTLQEQRDYTWRPIVFDSTSAVFVRLQKMRGNAAGGSRHCITRSWG
jgi:hypothetical protein